MTTPVKTLETLAKLVGGEVRGNATKRIAGVAPLQVAGPDELSWASDARQRSKLAGSSAGAVLVSDRFGQTPQPAIVCRNVDHALAQILATFAAPIPGPPVGVDAAAQVDPTAVLGAGVAIGPNVVIGADARIGDDSVLDAGVYIGPGVAIGGQCRLWPNVVVRERCVLGNRVTIHANSVIGADGFGYYFHEGRHERVPHLGGVVIGDDVEIGACACVDRSKTGNTVIGAGVKIDNLVQVAHNVVIGANSVLCAQVGVAGSAQLGDYVVLGGHVGVRDNIVLHDRVQVAACSCVPQDVEAGSKVAGLPAIEFRQYLRENASMRKLPGLVAQVRELLKRVEELEAAADDKPDG